jgi:hypothetical protein
MSIVSSIRDYVEFLNSLSDSLGNQLTPSKLMSETFTYFFKTFQYILYSIFSFHWIRDFTLLPVTISKYTDAIFTESLFLENPSKIYFEFLEIPSLHENKFLLGICNSFFLTLPITVTHFIAFRRLLIQGIPAGLVSFLGFILGQTLFILCVTFGIRSILIPWLSLEPLNYILGLILTFQIVYTMVGENLIPIKWNLNTNKPFFLQLFLTNTLLSWCEQSCIFQYLSNITVNGHPTILENFSTQTTLANFLSHSTYIFGIFLGSILFSVLWIFTIWTLKNFIINVTGISLATFLQNVNRATFVLALGFTLSSIPFYSLDYLATGPLGFISQDSAFKNTIFDQNKIKDPLSFIVGEPDQPFNYDFSTFDRGKYLPVPKGFSVNSFEDLNYRGEMDWTTRIEKQSTTSAGFLNLTKFVQKKNTTATPVSSFDEVRDLVEANRFIPEDQLETNEEESTIEVRFVDSYLKKSSLSDFAYLQNLSDDFQEKSFNTDSPYFNSQRVMEPQVEKKIKQKYYSNPIYHNLLKIDIDLFLNRQPNSSFLGGQHEFNLYQKRQILTSYYDSLRAYSELPYSEKFENFFNGTKSFSNKVYNQQFKGTVRSLRRLFSLSILSTDSLFEKTKRVESVLKYDQPLYEKRGIFSPYHEEVPELDSFVEKSPRSKSVAAFLGDEQKHSSSFLRKSLLKPLYAGWDENLRKFVLTNKLLPRQLTGYEMTLSSEIKDSLKNKKQLKNKGKIKFSVWPKPLEIFTKEQSDLPFVVLFTQTSEISQNMEAPPEIFYQSLPSNYKLVLTEGFSPDNLVPKRGGFVWPGSFSFPFKKIFK